MHPRVVLVAVLGAMLWSRPADACSYIVGFDEPTVYCARTGTVPPNAILREAAQRGLEKPDDFAPDVAVSARLDCASKSAVDDECPAFLRLKDGTARGTPVRSVAQNPYSCPFDVTVEGEADTTPPDQPRIADVVIDIKSDPADTGCLSCPDLDTLTVFLTNVRDDRAPRRQMYVAIYVGQTVEEAMSRKSIDHLLDVFDASEVDVASKMALDPAEGTPIALSAVLGKSVGHERTEPGLLRGGPVCFAVEIMDWAGNLSPRSDALCLDHTDEADPRVRSEDGSCACSIRGARPAGSIAITLCTLLGVALLSRRRAR